MKNLSICCFYFKRAAPKAFPDLNKHSRPVNPYRGLESFREQDARFYFGRESDTTALRKKVEQQPFTAVIGASGSGKSSLVLAGVIPTLRRTGDWLIADCRPKKQPFYELSSCLVPLLYDDELEVIKRTRQCAADFYAGELSLSGLIRRIVQKKGVHRFLLVVDQFEELYTLNEATEARCFIDLLLEAEETNILSVVITMRADFLETALHYGVFAEALKKALIIVPPISEDGLREAVAKPAELFTVAFESGLIDLIIRDVGKEPGNLPLLEFCLTQLWERQEFRRITHAAYTAIGGVQQALANYADAVYNSFCEEQDQVRIQQIFLNLIRPSRGLGYTRQARPIEEFRPEHKILLQKLTNKRLLVTLNDDTGKQIEIIHEALIRYWQPLQNWINKEQEFLVWREELKENIRVWRKRNKDRNMLLKGKILCDASNWQSTHMGYLGKEEQRFIDKSRKKERLKFIIPGITIFFLFILLDMVDPQKSPLKKTGENATETSSSMGQHIDSYKVPLKFVSTKIFFDTEVLQGEFGESSSASHQRLVHNIFFIPENKRHVKSDLEHNVLRGKEFEATIPFLQDCKDTSLYRTFMEGVTFCQQVEESGCEAVYAERTPADLKKYGTLLAPPPPNQSKFDQVLEWAEKQQER